MRRGTFLKAVALGAAATRLNGNAIAAGLQPSVVKPPRLKHGQKVALIAPGCFVSESEVQKSIDNLELLGVSVVLGKYLTTKYGYFSANDKDRAKEVLSFFEDTSVSGIFCARGGYGTARILPHLDYALIRRNPKIFCGYSDATALQQALYRKCGLVSFHGPLGISTFSEFSLMRLKEMLFEDNGKLTVPLIAPTESDSPEWDVLRAGNAQGRLAGGNLSVLVSLVGTPFDMDYQDCILYLEETDEEPYRIDRMLTHLAQAGKFNGVKAIVLGAFTHCVPNESSSGIHNSFSLREIFSDAFLDLHIPVISGASFGHIKNKLTIPFGINAEVDSERRELKLLENCTV